MFQKDNLFEWRTIANNVYIGLELQNKKTKENIEYVKLGGYVSESGKVVYLEHTADMMKNSVLYVGAPDVSDVPAEYETEVTFNIHTPYCCLYTNKGR